MSYEDDLRARLKRPMRYFQRVDSTQDIALAWISEGAEAGSVVIADEQMRGRGRGGRVWHTPPDVAIALSFVLKPRTPALTHVMMAGALAIALMAESISRSSARVSIKWPNDVRLNGRKISGVLPEAIWRDGRLQGIALGIGINIRNQFDDTELALIATSIEAEIGGRVERPAIVADVVARLDDWSGWLGSERLHRAWYERLDTIGQQVEINGIRGTATGANADGALLVRSVDGVTHTVLAGDLNETG